LSPSNFPGYNKTHFGLHVKCPIFLSDINKISISRQIFIKDLGIKFHENPSSGKGVDTCGQMDGQTEMTMLLEVFHYHSNTPDNVQHAQIYLFIAYLITLSIHWSDYVSVPSYLRGTRWRSWLRHCATSRKVAGSIPDVVTGFFH